MVAANPLFEGSIFSIKKFQATVINDIWPEVLFFTLIATMVSLVSKMTDTHLGISNQMLTVLGTVLGLVISFRTSTAYERFSEGRRLWTTITIASRNLAQVIWVHVPTNRPAKGNVAAPSTLHVMIEKKSMVNLVQAYSVSVKHLLRGEAGVYYSDLYPLISFLPRFSSPDNISPDNMLPLWKASDMDHDVHCTLRSKHLDEKLHRSASTPTAAHSEEKEGDAEDSAKGWFPSLRKKSPSKKFDPEQALANIPSEHPLKPARSPPNFTLYDYLPFLRVLKPILRPISRRARADDDPKNRHRSTFTGRKLRPDAADSNVPLEITLFLTNYFAWLMRQGLLTPASATTMITAINSLQDTVTNLERIKNTPLPFAYQAHLRLSLWLYLFFLPFQIYGAFGYLCIPATAFASFLLTGFLEIGQEISLKLAANSENPFNYDLNDLDLDHFCLTIQRELHEITAHTCPEPNSFIFTQWNQPFAPADRRNAKEMMDDIDHSYHGPDTGMDSIRKTLLKSWRDVDEVTRHS
ncbi:hypothetical protein NLI96_g9513 [Meripilus lineatus]|uniref:Uncharacterized protein n=1 Tax=Meripilus lineatus TaxID=2056292 RepID=A0AAD5V0J8_9APHY|nr:hypothetical protein NLI96_g9513 [Physisporinus lineatus]